MEDRIAALRARVAGLAPDQRAAFRVKVEAAGIDWARVAPPAEDRAVPARLPLSSSQMQFWLTQALRPDSAAFTITFAWDLRGPLDAEALRTALQVVMDRHAPLRSRFPSSDGTPWQDVLDAVPAPLTVHPLPDDATACEQEFTARPFDMTEAPLWRAALYSDGGDTHHLFFAFHHIIADGWSRGVFLRELTVCYRALSKGARPDLRPLGRSFPNMVLDQADWLNSPVADRQVTFWRKELANLAVQDIPSKGPSPDRRAATVLHELPEALAGDAKGLAQSLGITPFILMLAVFQLLLHRQTGSDDIAVGTPTAGRTSSGAEDLIGLFVNTLVLRNRPRAGIGFRDWVQEVCAAFVRAFDQQDLPFARVVEAVGAARRADQSPLFQTLFQLQSGYGPQNADALNFGDPRLDVTQRVLPLPEAKFDLSWHMMDRADGVSIIVEYRAALFDAPRITDMLAQFETLLAEAIAAPNAPIETLEFVPKEAALVDHGPVTAIPDLLTMFGSHRDRTDPAVICATSGKSMTYGALWKATDVLARQLSARPELQGAARRMAICLPRGVGVIVSMLAALKAGIAYVPLDPDHPEARRRAILQDAEVGLILSDRAQDAPCPALDPMTLDETAPQAALPPPDPDRLAYLIFTSGSTGRPKGVPITHGALSNLIASVANTPGMSAGDRFLAVTTVAFDIAALELFLPLVVGGSVVLADRDVTTDPEQLAQALDHHGITHMQATPASWRMLLDHGWQGRTGLVALCGGEALAPDLAGALQPRVAALWNMYGPTETTIWSAALQVTPEHLAQGQIPLGGPVASTSLQVLDQYGAALPADIPGELAIGGAGLSPGYWRNTDLSGDRFPVIKGQRLYRTGDLVARNRDGTFRFLGRLDHQIKLNGFRIEPGEIETSLRRQDGVEEALVVVTGDRLVAYLRGTPVATVSLRAALGEDLPEYMIPASFVWLDAFPLNSNGKIDRAQLPMPDAPGGTGTGPVTPTERTLHGLWRTVLGRPDIGIDDNFFDIGGASVSAMQIASRARGQGLTVTPAQMFEHQTIRAQAAICDHTGASETAPTDSPLSLWQASTSAGPDWHVRIPLEAGDGARLPEEIAAMTRAHPVLRAARAAMPVSGDTARGHWSAECSGDFLHLRAAAALVDAASIERIALELRARLQGAFVGSPVPLGSPQKGQSPTWGDVALPAPLRGDGIGGPASTVPQRIDARKLRAVGEQTGADPAHSLAAALLRLLAQWQRRPSGILLIQDAPAAAIGCFTRAVPILLNRVQADQNAALARVRSAIASAPPQGVDPQAMPKGLVVLSWRHLPGPSVQWLQSPAHPAVAGAALTINATQTSDHLDVQWTHDPDRLRPETLTRLAARVLSETLTVPTTTTAGNKLDKLKSRLTTKGQM